MTVTRWKKQRALLTHPTSLLMSFIVVSLLIFTLPSVQHASLVGDHIVKTGRGLAWSLDGGRTWRELSAFAGVKVHALAQPAEASSTVYVGAEDGLYVSHDSGARWSPLLSTEVFAVATTGDALFIGTRQGLRVSTDGGKRWQAIDGGLPEGVVPLTLSTSDQSEVIYLGSARHGVFKSLDGGKRWQAVNTGLPSAIGAAPVTPVEQLVVDPTNHHIAYAASEVNGLYKTTDGGQHWQAINHGLPGVMPYRTYAPLLALDPTNPQIVYTVIGFPVHSHLIQNMLYRSLDGGAHWDAIKRLPDNRRFGSLQVSASAPPRAFIGGTNGVLSLAIMQAASAKPDVGLEVVNPPARSASQAAARDIDVGNIAVVHDDGTLSALFDLDQRAISYVLPSRSRVYRINFSDDAFDSELGARLPLGDDDAQEIELPFAFRFYQEMQTSVFVHSDGRLTFGVADPDPTPSLVEFVAEAPQIAPLWNDLDPSSGGGVFVKSLPDRVVITWNQVPEFGRVNANTFQVVLTEDNTIIMVYKGIEAETGIVGISNGNQFRLNFVDFSQDLPATTVNTPVAEQFDGFINIAAVGQRFYQTHRDDFDFLATFLAGSAETSPFFFAFESNVSNEVAGIGLGRFDQTAAFGSAGRLKSFVFMNSLALYPDDPNKTFLGTNSALGVFGQEAGHRWLAFVNFDDGGRDSNALLGRQLAHWSFFFDSDASVMEGNDWRDNGDGTFISVDATNRYSALDQYIMGLRAPEEVPPSFLIGNGRAFFRDPTSAPAIGVTANGQRQDISVDQIIAAEGARSPRFGQSPTSFRMAFVLFVPEGGEATQADLEKLERIRHAWMRFFNQATDGRGAMITTLAGSRL